jgi:hypothetical protein
MISMVIISIIHVRNRQRLLHLRHGHNVLSRLSLCDIMCLPLNNYLMCSVSYNLLAIIFIHVCVRNLQATQTSLLAGTRQHDIAVFTVGDLMSCCYAVHQDQITARLCVERNIRIPWEISNYYANSAHI